MNIYYSNPYSIEKNFGKAINDFCQIVPNDDDWIVIQDGDICYLTPEWGRIIHDSLALNGDRFGLIGCYTNCLNSLDQLHGKKRVIDLPMIDHYHIAKSYQSLDIVDFPKGIIAGFWMAFKKSTWKKVGCFSENDRSFDITFSLKVQKAGMRIGIMQGLYVYHLYRIWDNGNPLSIDHLKKND